MGVAQSFDLTGRVALVTGGSSGLGLQIATAYAEQGARLAIVARSAERLEDAAEQLRSAGAEILTVAADLTDRQASAAIVGRVLDEWGGIDVLVNNAGATWGAPAEDHPVEAWDKVIGLNLTAVFRLTTEVARASMLRRGHGRVVMVASVAGLIGNHPAMAGTVAYSTSKGGLIAMTRALAAEWANRGITVNAIAPGFFPTRMTRGTLAAAGDALAGAIPLGRVGGPDDLAGAAVLLGSDASAYMTGQVIAVDGGITAV